SLEGEIRRFAQRRDDEANAGETIAGLRVRLDGLRHAQASAASVLDTLGQRYSPRLLAPIAGNLDEAEKVLSDAARRLDDISAELASTRVSAVGDELRSLRDGLARAAMLLDAIEH